MLQLVVFAALAVAQGCDQPALSLTLSEKGSQHWSGNDYAPPGECRNLTISFPSNSTLLLSVTGKARAANVDTFTIADRLNTLLESSDVISGTWRVPNGVSADWHNTVSVQLNTAIDQTPSGDITIHYEVLELVLRWRTDKIYPIQFPIYQSSVVEPLSLMPDHNVTLAFSATDSDEQLDFSIVSEAELSPAQMESLVNVFVADGNGYPEDMQRPRCRLLSALSTPCRTSNAAYILSLDDANSHLLTLLTVIVTRKSFSKTPIQYQPFFLNKGSTDTSITWTGQNSSIVPLILKYYSEPTDGVFVKSIDYKGPGDFHVFTGGASRPGSYLDLFYTGQNDSALWRDFVLHTPWAYSLAVPQGGKVQMRLGNARNYKDVVDVSQNSRGVIMSSRHPLRTVADASFNRTMTTGGKPSNYLFWSSTAFDVGNGEVDFHFVRKDKNEDVRRSYIKSASPVGLSESATDLIFSYKTDPVNSHVGFLLRYYISPVKIAPTASLIATLVLTLLVVY